MLGHTAALSEDFAEGCAGLLLPVVRLAGEGVERTGDDVSPAGEEHGFRLFASPGIRMGWASQPVLGSAQSAALGLYRRLLRAASGRWLYRIWNYVPAINSGSDEMENYRQFNAGRARAFEEAFGAGYGRHLPAASAVGCEGGDAALIFVAGDEEPRHFENPEQTPAYHYPPEHGQRPPSFARATVVNLRGRRRIYISGTSAIKGHSTVAAGSTADKVDCTLENLRVISRVAGAGDDLGAAVALERQFKVYLRHATDLPAVRARLEGSLLRPGDPVVWLRADLCRATLNVEIEATLSCPAIAD